MGKKIRNTLVFLLLLVLVGVLIYPRLEVGKFSSNSQTANKPKDVPVVKVKVLDYQVFEDKIMSNGTVLANETVELRPEVSGKITSILFKEGDYVMAGTPLVTIYNEELKAQLRKLEANKKLIETNEFRQKKLLEKEAISQQEYDVAQNQLATINAEIEVLKEQIKKTTIVAPFDGVLGLRLVSLGAYVSPNTVITSLTNFNPAKIQFAIPAKYGHLVNNGSTIRFSTESDNRIFEGKVYAIEPKIDEATRSIQIRALCPNPSKQLLPGAFVRVELIIQKTEKALLLPTEAVIPEMENHKVFVIKAGKAQPQKVVVGNRTETEVLILQGLNKGDTVVTSGILKLKKDIPVKIKEVI
ncbi:MAG: efflux RND transporter periplasmic adaptor subunit [Microscillaceae bacterium]|nr:efflux RND transporter periplasmic adaptor subunit [Microscillaceae bacterium]MDW8459645.1 efflux RND transporter periplasmic adaptor subunit [Cytophagales bacterium]